MTPQTAETSSTSGSSPRPTRADHSQRLANLRTWMGSHGVDAVIVRTTDRYLNEYVPQVESTREWLTGFTGSTGEAMVTMSKAFLFVDGRYHLQADQEINVQEWTVVKLGMAEPVFNGVTKQVQELVTAGEIKRVGYETDRFTLQDKEALEKVLTREGTAAVGLLPSPVEEIRGAVTVDPGRLRVLDEARLGRTSAEKVTLIQEALRKASLDVMLVQRLDDLAYLCNLRGNELPFQATFKGMGAVGIHGAVVCFHSRSVPAELPAQRDGFTFVSEKDFPEALKKVAGNGRKAGVDNGATTEAARAMLVNAGFTVTPMTNPLTDMKAVKTSAELACMAEAFHKADRAIHQCISWVCHSVEKGERVTEADVAHKMEELFTRGGAVGLSFKIIAAAGKNGAIIHYSTPDPNRVLQKGELMLLDTGAYYEEGYATDLTRTFLVGGPSTKPTDEQCRLFTLTLKAALGGMMSVIPTGTPGISLDALTRKALWDAGLTYNHGTGHGVGVNVHELPPTVSLRAITPLQVGYVFSIEPGVYLPDWGGIRIENLCTLEEHPERQGWLRVKPMTFCPLDTRLIDPKLLSPAEMEFLKKWEAEGEAVLKESR